MPETVQQSEPEQEHNVQAVPTGPPRRRHRLARCLGALVGLLIMLIILAAVGLPQLALDNQALGHVSDQINRAQRQQTQIHAQVAATLASIQGLLHTISAELQIRIQTVSHAV